MCAPCDRENVLEAGKKPIGVMMRACLLNFNFFDAGVAALLLLLQFNDIC